MPRENLGKGLPHLESWVTSEQVLRPSKRTRSAEGLVEDEGRQGLARDLEEEGLLADQEVLGKLRKVLPPRRSGRFLPEVVKRSHPRFGFLEVHGAVPFG